MKLISTLLSAALLTLRAVADPIGELLFPPELLERAQREIALTDEQRRHIQEAAEKVGERFRDLQERVQKEAAALAVLVQPGRVDAAAALAQLDRLLDAESEIKRAQIGFLLTIKNELSPGQQASLIAFRVAEGSARTAEEGRQKRLVEKAARVRAGVEKVSENGGTTASIAAIMEEARGLMEKEKSAEAEAAIDRALKLLDAGK